MKGQSMPLDDGTVQWRVLDDDGAVLEYGIETSEAGAGLSQLQAMSRIRRARRVKVDRCDSFTTCEPPYEDCDHGRLCTGCHVQAVAEYGACDERPEPQEVAEHD